MSPDPSPPLSAWLERAERCVSILSRAAAALAALSSLACLALVCYAVATRYFFGRPQAWTDEVVGWLLVGVVMLAVPEAQRQGRHIGVDWLVDKWTGARQRLVLGTGAASVAIVAGLLVAQGWEMVVFTRMIGILPNTLPQVPLWAIQALVPLGGVLLLIVALLQIARWMHGLMPVEERREADSHE